MNGRSVVRVVSLSGGKDSTAVALLALENGPGRGACRFVYADTGNEHELTEQYIFGYLQPRLGIKVDVVRADFSARIEAKRRYVEEKWPEKGVDSQTVARALEVLHPTGNPFLDLCLWKGRFPSRRAQFCTTELKRRPLDAYLFEMMAQGHSVESWRGIRRDESSWRSKAPAREEMAEGFTLVHPIVDWTAQQTVDFVRARGIDLNPLYSMGMKRVGCMPCINCSKDELLEISKRCPEHVDRIREWERLVSLAAKRGRTSFFTEKMRVSSRPRAGWTHFPSAPGEPEHWVEPMADLIKRCQIDSRIEWAKTSRGGVQYDLLRVEKEAPMCSSVYGLCE